MIITHKICVVNTKNIMILCKFINFFVRSALTNRKDDDIMK